MDTSAERCERGSARVNARSAASTMSTSSPISSANARSASKARVHDPDRTPERVALRCRRSNAWPRVLASALLVACGCRLGPDFVAPKDEAAASWKAGAAAESAALLAPSRAWWVAFGDDELARLVDRALQHNEDLAAAVARVEAARAAAGLARTAQPPGIDVNASVERQRYSANRSTPPGASGSAYTASDHDVALDLAWELDLWGRLRRASEAAGAAAEASALDRDALAVAVAGEVARVYFDLRTTERELAVVADGARLRREALAMLAGRAQAGVGDDLDTSRAETELARVEGDQGALERRRAALENALAVLCGASPSEFTVARSAGAPVPPDVPAGLPSELLRRRPDVAAAVARLHAASARIGATEADAYPRFSLTGSIGLVSGDLARWFEASSRTAAIGLDANAPVYHGGANEERLRAARAAYDERAAEYRQALLVAFREVEDALSALASLRGEAEARARAQRAAQRTLELATGRFEQGLVSQLEVVDAARAELDARRALVQLEGLRAETTVLLIRALGGGWTAPQPDER